MELEGGIPAHGRTLCVVVALLTGPDSGPKLAGLLERYRLANRDAGAELRFGILADLPDSGTPMGETGRAWVESAREAVEQLNRKYGGGFYLFFRRPQFSPRDEKYLGWERKRGALLQLVRLLKDRPAGLEVEAGDRESLRGTKFVITLDSDTSLNVGTARELVGAMLHPLNQPEVDRKRRVVASGHALFQPRVAVDLEAANRSLFSRVFGGLGGVDPYGSAASDVDQACLEVTQEDPLGAYAVDYIKYDVGQTAAYYEVTVKLAYTKTPQEIAQVVSVTGTSAIAQELQGQLAFLPRQAVFRVSYFTREDSAESIRQAVLEAYGQQTLRLPPLEEVQVNLYPDSGQQRVVEILLTWGIQEEFF